MPWGYGATRHQPSEMPSGGSCKKLKVSFGCQETAVLGWGFPHACSFSHAPSHMVLGERGLHQGGPQPPSQGDEVVGMWH